MMFLKIRAFNFVLFPLRFVESGFFLIAEVLKWHGWAGESMSCSVSSNKGIYKLSIILAIHQKAKSKKEGKK
jgi:hypothetical protein